MERLRGTSRVVVVGDNYVAKLPLPKLKDVKSFISCAKLYIKQKRWNELRALMFTGEESPHSFCGRILRGWFENLREAELSEELGDIVVPTRFSLFGVLNIMDRADVLGESTVDDVLLAPFCDRLTAPHRAVSRHTFSNPKNFGWHDGRLKLVDYGAYKLYEVLTENRDKILAGLNEYSETFPKT